MGTDGIDLSTNKPAAPADNPQWLDTLHGADHQLALSIMRGQPSAPGHAQTPLAPLGNLSEMSGRAVMTGGVERTLAGAPLDLTPPGLRPAAKPISGNHKLTGPIPIPQPRPHETGPSPACKPSPAYQDYITFAERKIWDIKSLGDPDKLLHRFDCDIHNTKDAMAKASEALKITGDRYNYVETPEKSRREDAEISGHSSGIGIRAQSAILTPENKVTKQKATYSSVIDDLIPGSPAAKAGLRLGDQIMTINGKSTAGMESFDIDHFLSGNKGTTVKVGLVRDGKPFEATMVRQDVDMPSVRNGLDLGNGVGYIQIFSFGDGTAEELSDALDDVKNAKTLIIDLRNNGGGLLDTSVEAAELLVKKGVLLRTDERMDSDIKHPQFKTVEHSVDDKNSIITSTETGVQPTITKHERFPYKAGDRPIIVLTNGNTASAAEILAGALRDSAGATLIGEQTFGKGIGQTIERQMTGGAATKVTSFHYTTPSGEWPGDADKNKHGLTPLPQFVVHNPDSAFIGYSNDLQLERAKAFGLQLIGTP